ncbi:sensor histidine kinase [Photobacterium sanctipauli]|uniref:histidine kinase n=1 Tax=Photobacterium sanctipauli TaxID=1342794 RepID=A0A2T3NUN2_9GAMM|nr:HAMP domain-containing sensor histidine kinase [Photobacterium sanctipauli]PSW19967.1 sensor histidine kinase [Photobacterium sanctipauli]
MKEQLKKVKSAKQLTFTYFSIVAFAIITIHVSLIESTLEDFEHINANNRLRHAKEVAAVVFEDSKRMDIGTSPFTHAYIGKEALPSHVNVPNNLPYDKAVELHDADNESTEYFIMRSPISIRGKEEVVYFLYYDDLYELSEEQVFNNEKKQLLITVFLLFLSFFVVSRISERLTHPLSKLASELDQRKSSDLTPITLPSGIVSRELVQLVYSFNLYAERIQELLERERAFNRYASHELRTPLMVMKGAVSLLGQSNDPAFIEKQRQRLLQSSNDMNDFVTALLSLTREESNHTLAPREITREELESTIASHDALIKGKDVKWHIELSEPTYIKAPETTFKILLGNLIKNAFACTEEGSVTVTVSNSKIEVIDTGIGLGSKPRGVEGFGLGLLIANDICRKYHWTLSHSDNEYGGCTATISLLDDEKPNAQTK